MFVKIQTWNIVFVKIQSRNTMFVKIKSRKIMFAELQGIIFMLRDNRFRNFFLSHCSFTKFNQICEMSTLTVPALCILLYQVCLNPILWYPVLKNATVLHAWESKKVSYIYFHLFSAELLLMYHVPYNEHFFLVDVELFKLLLSLISLFFWL